MLSFLPKEPQEIMEELRVKLKARRKSMSYTQTECATRSGVSNLPITSVNLGSLSWSLVSSWELLWVYFI